MREIGIEDSGEGKRLDSFLTHYLSGAPESLLYKQLRKKNITLNGKSAKGNERLAKGDRIQCFFSDETFERFMDPRLAAKEPAHCSREMVTLNIAYEDEAVMIVDKPAGLLTQAAKKNDDCLNARVVSLLISRGELTAGDTVLFAPSACHRLDRNTSGLVVCAKTRAGADAVSALFRGRTLEKYYMAPVHGRIVDETVVDAPLSKDADTNTVIVDRNGDPAVTVVTPIRYLPDADVTLVRLKPVTGRSHQLRVHMAHISHPIVGDRKYGGRIVSSDEAKHQLLCCYELVFPETEGDLAGLSGKRITVRPPFESRYSL
ncbi:MAG: RluA family pseudouridine synthase [Lachnospiraceae bacterium]|nr:RluA family pseudouridine synthase [Lachnospiraceae bacterium]